MVYFHISTRMKLFVPVIFFVHVCQSLPVDIATGRVLESIESFPEMDRDLTSRVRLQIQSDEWNAEWTPKTDENHSMTEETFLGHIELEDILHRGDVSFVATIANRPGRVIKYQLNCDLFERKVHPLIREYWYMNEAHAKGLAPAALFLSPPSFACDSQEGKCEFEISSEDYEYCRGRNATLRYLIMEQAAGVSLHQFRRAYFVRSEGAVGFKNAISIGAKLLDLVRQLHTEANIVHGDIHTPNVMIDWNSETSNFTLQLIDFGSAFYKFAEPLPENQVRKSGHYYHHFYTIWQMLGFHWSARDDVLKVLHTIAHLMHPWIYFRYEKQIAEAGFQMLKDWKLNQNWFSSPLFDPLENVKLSKKDRQLVEIILDEILHRARHLRINDEIPYLDIEHRLMECLEVFK